ncbi:hypothetical protein TVAG_486310 [Trichomonas vaginalis G3]|uniref:Uncharacterized protein n=1 Tax=Trichomonas vaginalis (strain ATCC PRA-98 / G3) TaxID=412133 RepID=A2EEH8_TRIV3|nr:hypothetical protein TVAGG3_0691020 [Trichomonas vaginalis G3]EAY08984.1 hypothetical protein TVAG_486310 [Trichomonas vaginalis G3]KAI5508567.1 hypothetical protein TVAGG3_0691020 [Trichomonas vaginalis G3]|eukprot:XP_001321207.1 hypothetical protein [Trichomonas vaginalis G3]
MNQNVEVHIDGIVFRVPKGTRIWSNKTVAFEDQIIVAGANHEDTSLADDQIHKIKTTKDKDIPSAPKGGINKE